MLRRPKHSKIEVVGPKEKELLLSLSGSKKCMMKDVMDQHRGLAHEYCVT
jgi:hypothetical protein